MSLGVLRGVQAVAVGGFDQHHVGGCRHLRHRHQQVAHAADVTREQQRAAAMAHVDAAGAQQVAGGREAHVGRAQAQLAVARQRRELLERRLGLAHAVQRQSLVVPAAALLVGPAGVFLLQVGTVAQQHIAQVPRGGGRVDRALEALAAECGQVAAVVEVGVGEQHRVELHCGRSERSPVAFAQGFVALEQASIEQEALLAQGQQVARARDGVGGAEESEFHGAPRVCMAPDSSTCTAGPG
jgi:hypothetical protein